MALQPAEWNVVVMGRWNPALFTPAAISRRIFGLPEGTPVEVFVVLDDYQQPRVRHNGIMIAPSFTQLLVLPAESGYAELARAMTIARDATTELPKTPFLAAGYNLRYYSDTVPESLARLFSDNLDLRFADNGFQIRGRQFHRILDFRNGNLLVRVTREPDGRAEVLLNFELPTKESEQIREWLSVPIGEVRATAERVLTMALQLGDDCVFENVQHREQSPAVEVAPGNGG